MHVGKDETDGVYPNEETRFLAYHAYDSYVLFECLVHSRERKGHTYSNNDTLSGY